MLLDSIYIAGTGSFIARLEPPSDAVPAETLARWRQVSAATSPELTGPELAARAAETALRRSSVPGDAVRLHLHATMYDQGLEIWNASAYIASQAGLSRAWSFEVRQ